MPVSAPFPTPAPNAGAHAQGTLYASQALDALKKSMAMLDPGSPLGQAVLHALKAIGAKVGSVPQGQQMNSLQSQLLEARRNAMQRMQMMQQARAGAGQQNPLAALMSGGAQQQQTQPSAAAAA